MSSRNALHRRKKHNKKHNKNRQPSGFQGERNVRIRSVGHVVPEEVITELTWINQGDFSGASPQITTAYHGNDIYDIDPAVGGVFPIGYTQWEGFYDNFRVLGYKVNLTVTNLQDFPVSCFMIDSTLQNTSAGSMQQFSGGPNGRSYVLGPKGSTQATKRIRYSKRITDIVGSRAPLTADNFMGTTGGSLRVADHTWINIGFNSMTGVNLTLGVAWLWRVTFITKFYARKII